MDEFKLIRDFYAGLNDIISDPDFPMYCARQIRDYYKDFINRNFLFLEEEDK